MYVQHLCAVIGPAILLILLQHPQHFSPKPGSSYLGLGWAHFDVTANDCGLNGAAVLTKPPETATPTSKLKIPKYLKQLIDQSSQNYRKHLDNFHQANQQLVRVNEQLNHFVQGKEGYPPGVRPFTSGQALAELDETWSLCQNSSHSLTLYSHLVAATAKQVFYFTIFGLSTGRPSKQRQRHRKYSHVNRLWIPIFCCVMCCRAWRSHLKSRRTSLQSGCPTLMSKHRLNT